MPTRNEFFQFYENIDSVTIIKVVTLLGVEQDLVLDLGDNDTNESDITSSEVYEIENIETLKDYGWRGHSITAAVGELQPGKQYILYQEYSRTTQGYGDYFTTERLTPLTSDIVRSELQWIKEFEKQDW